MASNSTEIAAINVFINCPFDETYRHFFRGIVFAVTICGFRARCALERSDSGQTRFEKITRILSDCPLGIHDISKTDLDPVNQLPRFNMPLELGLFLGMRYSGNPDHAGKQCLIFDRERYRYQKFISDIAGQDIATHNDDPNTLVGLIRDWLKSVNPGMKIPRRKNVVASYDAFATNLPAIIEKSGIGHETELTYYDLADLIGEWIVAQRSTAP